MSEPAVRRFYLSLGSNIEPARHLPAAVKALGQYGRIVAVSSAWESPPADGSDQAHYVNAAVLLEADLSPEEFCGQVIPSIEASLGRRRDPLDKYAPRTIDIDLSLVDQDTLQIGHRRIPDPDILTRAFVVVPLAEIAPEYVHPQTGETLQQIARRLWLSQPSLVLRREITREMNEARAASKGLP
ncbi:MAG: 2-amino-4-hydroxy-6-hydroxymethyldihydropteridine diphosphokinase [Planctomycetes bacterium]|nr:2-amino-4-hydroxy-6-hydroxymethyldihydropteridine diphosphokinase [Planctomycetota bacterium]